MIGLVDPRIIGCPVPSPSLTWLGRQYTNAYNAEIETVELVAGDNGVYDVELDGELVFSKDKQERFPENGELVRLAEKHTPTA